MCVWRRCVGRTTVQGRCSRLQRGPRSQAASPPGRAPAAAPRPRVVRSGPEAAGRRRPPRVAGARPCPVGRAPPRRGVVRSSLAGLWEHLGQSPPAGSVVAAELSSGSGGCCRGRAVRLGRARTWRFGSAPAPRPARSGRSAGACVAPDSPSQRWCEPRARLSPAAAADPGPPLHGRLGAAPTGQAGGRWRPRTAPCAAQHREEAGQGR